jgi:hypothetical protein
MSAVAYACGGSSVQAPLAPSAGTPFGGTWVLTIGVESCTGSHYCIALDSEWFALRLVQEHAHVRGVADVAGKAVDVIGTVDPAGQLALTSPSRDLFTLNELTVRADARLGMTGFIDYTASPVTLRGHIASAKRFPLEPTQTTVAGTWIVSAVVRRCTYSSFYTECPLPILGFKLSLNQSGTGVSGIIDSSYGTEERFQVPVRGAFTSSMLTLAGTRTYEMASGATFQQRLLSWTTWSDPFGRMTGSFTYETESADVNRRVTVRYEAEIEDVYLLPPWFPLR